ncbi:MAG: murein hydrolase activator EnvC [Geminicoccaceae bacterium]
MAGIVRVWLTFVLAIVVCIGCSGARAQSSSDECRLRLVRAEQERDRATARSERLAAIAANDLNALEALRKEAASLDDYRLELGERLRAARTALAAMLAASATAPADPRRLLVLGELVRTAAEDTAELLRWGRERTALGGWLRAATAARSRVLSQVASAETLLDAAGASWRSALRARIAAIEAESTYYGPSGAAAMRLVPVGPGQIARRPAPAPLPEAKRGRKRSLGSELRLDPRFLRAAVPPPAAKRRLPFVRTRDDGGLLPIAGALEGLSPGSPRLKRELKLTTRVAQTVSAPVPGEVVYARPFRDLGPLLIIDQGGGYHVVLVGMTQLDVGEGARLVAGQSVGRIEARADEPASLYMQLRHEGVPLDPAAWPRAYQDKVAS